MTQGKPADMESSSETAQSVLDVGETLKAARVVKGLSIQEVASRLRLDADIVTDIEANSHNNLPDAIFVRGYIQNYAREIGLNAAPLLAAYSQLAPADPVLKVTGPKTKMKRSKSNGVMHFSKRRSLMKPVLMSLFIVIVSVIAWQVWPEYVATKSVESEHSLIPMTTYIESSAVVADVTIPKALAASNNIETIEVEPIVVESAVVINEIPELEDTTEVKLPLTPRALDLLKISTLQDSWVTIHDAEGKRVMYALLAAGKSKEVKGIAPFKVLLGFARDVELSINGQVIDVTPHIKKNSARFTVERP